MTRVAASLVLGATLTFSVQHSDWTAAGTKDGVVLHYRDDAGLGAREVRAVAELPHPADRIVSMVCDFTQTPDPGVRERKVLSGDLASRYEIYLRYNSRFMVVSARDVVIDVRRDAGGCAWSEVADREPVRPGTVRMPLLRGSWQVERLDDVRSRVTYQVIVRPGGSVPGWLVRRGAVDALPDIITRVSRRIAGED